MSSHPSASPVLAFDNATVTRADGGAVLNHFTWAVRPGETWAIVGPTASGKTTLLEAVQGKHRLTAGTWTPPAGSARLVAFKEDSRTFSYAGHYYQQRYEFADTDEPLSLEQYLLARTSAEPGAVAAIAEALGIAGQLHQPFLTLSNGQTRRARIAKALIAEPDWLLLDDPFNGIDTHGRTELAAILGKLVSAGRKLLLATAREWVPAWVTHVMELEGGRGRGIPTGDTSASHLSPLGRGRNGEAVPGEGLLPHGKTRPPHPVAPQPTSPQRGEVEERPPIIEMRCVTVRHGGKAILDGVGWTVRRGERWAVVGPNGAGKTTLLALLCGDHPQAFSNDVKLFGRRRGTGETIWDVKRKIGFVSPEFHLYFREPLTAFEAAATAFGDSLLYRAPTPDQAEAVRVVFAAFGCEDLQSRKFARLSVGQQRLVLLARAVVKAPPLLILDEPFQGLDATTADRIRDWLDATLRPDQTLIFVTHVPAQVPGTVTRELRLANGRVVD